MPDAVSQVREIAKSLGISIPEERLEALAATYEQTWIEVESVRSDENPMPTPSPFEAGWSDRA